MDVHMELGLHRRIRCNQLFQSQLTLRPRQVLSSNTLELISNAQGSPPSAFPWDGQEGITP